MLSKIIENERDLQDGFSKILLINPPLFTILSKYKKSQTNIWPPIGLLSVASFLRNKGVEVEFLDLVMLNKPIEELLDKISRLNPQLIGLTCMSTQFPVCVNIARLLKKNFDIPIAFGGVHPTVEPEEVLSEPCVDFVIRGEGEMSIYNLVSALATNTSLDNIKGLGYKDRNGGLIINPLQEPIKDLDRLPLPAYDLLNMERYIKYNQLECGFRAISMIVSRGCIFPCSFCATKAVHGSHVRSRSPARVIKDIKQLTDEYDIEGVWFKDSTFTINREWILKLCKELIKKEVNIKWSCNTRTDKVDLFLLKSMKEAGCQSIWFGVESGSIEILKNLKKPIPIEITKKAFEMCKEIKIEPRAFFMLGSPGERIETIKQTLDLAQELYKLGCKHIHWHIFNPLPGSELYRNLKKKGYKCVDYSAIRFDKATYGTEFLNTKQINQIYNIILDHFPNNSRILKSLKW